MRVIDGFISWKILIPLFVGVVYFTTVILDGPVKVGGIIKRVIDSLCAGYRRNH